MNSTPIYYQTGTYAREHGELDQFRESHRASCECRHAIEGAISAHFDGMHLSRQALADVLEQFAPERVRLVLAATLCYKVYDGRFSSINRAWARAVPLPKVEPNSFHNPLDMYVLSTHPAVLDGFVTAFIRSCN